MSTAQELGEYRPSGFIPEAPRDDEEQAFLDTDACDIADEIAADENDTETEVAAPAPTADAPPTDKVKRPKRTYNPERDGPPITAPDFDDLVPRFTPALTRFLTARTSNRDLALEFVQETFFRAFRAVANNKQIALKFASPFLYRVAGNIANDYHRHKALIAWMSLDEPVNGDEDVSGDPLGNTIADERNGDDYPGHIDNREAIRAVVRWLPPHIRAHILYELEGTSVRERAAMLDSTETTEQAVKMQASRARSAFRAAFTYYMAHGRLPDTRFPEPKSDTKLLQFVPAQLRDLGSVAIAVSSPLPPEPEPLRRPA